MNVTHLAHRRRAVAALACAASVAGAVPALAPSGALASAHGACKSKTLTLRRAGSRPTRIPVYAVSVQGGVSCAQAYPVITKVLTTGKPPHGWKTVTAHFKVKGGLYPQEVRSGARIIRYAIHPG